MSKPVAFLMLTLVALSVRVAPAAVVSTELAGNSLGGYPFFEFVRAFNANATVEVAVDPSQFPSIVGMTADIYVVMHKPSWSLGDLLIDAGRGPKTFTLTGTVIRDNIIQVAGPGDLDSDAGTDIGVPYDVIIDTDRNGVFSDGDFLDGTSTEAGFYVVKDLVMGGPLAVALCLDYAVTGISNPTRTRERTCYPSLIASLGKLPLVVISHGNGHDYTWYDYLQQHLASHGYIVMSHQNDTVPGIETASTTTLQHTGALLGQQGTIGGGVLNGHIDSHRITWIGHSRGGEGVARAYDRIFRGQFIPVNYALQDIVLISSIAPTDFLGPGGSHPHGVNYHFLYGSADGDVCGCPSSDIAQAFHIFERATGFRQSTYVHGADHNDFNCCGFDDFTGPPGTAIGRPEAQNVAKAVYLALIKHYVEGNIPGKDYLWRSHKRFKPIGVSPHTTVVSEYKEGPASGKFVIDDYQSQPSPFMSSSGGLVAGVLRPDNINVLQEGLLDDNDTSFDWVESDPFNGMTRARTNDDSRGVVFSVAPTGSMNFLLWTIPLAAQDFSAFKYLSFRASQVTRHPFTTATLSDKSWVALLLDGTGGLGFVEFSVYGGGIPVPYQRTGFGIGAGWQNEFQTIRIRLKDLLTGAPGLPRLNLTNVQAVAFVFVDSSGTPVTARLALDDLELTVD